VVYEQLASYIAQSHPFPMSISRERLGSGNSPAFLVIVTLLLCGLEENNQNVVLISRRSYNYFDLDELCMPMLDMVTSWLMLTKITVLRNKPKRNLTRII